MKKTIIVSIMIAASAAGLMGQKGFERDTIPTSSGNLVITFIGHGSLLFTYHDRNIFIDPVLQVADFSPLPKADAILVTHDHGDHLDPAAIEKISKPGTELYINQLGFDKIHKGKACGAPDFFLAAGVPVEVTEAYNIENLRGNGKPYHARGEGNGYLLTFGETRVYVAGDTELIPEMSKLKDLTIAFLPIALPYTMSTPMAVEAAKTLKPKILYPYHYNNSNPDEVVRALIGSGIEVRVKLMK